jgi:hypothetical protein
VTCNNAVINAQWVSKLTSVALKVTEGEYTPFSVLRGYLSENEKTLDREYGVLTIRAKCATMHPRPEGSGTHKE